MPTNGDTEIENTLPKHYAKLDDPTPLHSSNDDPASDSESLLRRRRVIEPWLCSLFQAEHLALLVGAGLPIGVASTANVGAASMASGAFPGVLSTEIEVDSRRSAVATGRGPEPNIEDRLRTAIALHEGLRIARDTRATALRDEIDRQIANLLRTVLKGEEDFLAKSRSGDDRSACDLLKSFLLTFASRAGTRDRLHLFTTNYDRFIEFGCDQAGIRIIDRFIGAIDPVFRASRLNVDMHYNPPGIRGEPRYLEGVIRLTKLHGSLDWRANGSTIRRCMLPFGASGGHPEIPAKPYDGVIVFPNAAKDVETINYPYAELFRDFAAAVCRPNAVLVTFGYGFGDDHMSVRKIIAVKTAIPEQLL